MNPPFNNYLNTLVNSLETINEAAVNEPENSGETAPVKPRRIWQPPSGACCAGCGSADITGLPTYSVGSGVALRPYADDVLCQKCGQIAPPQYQFSDER